ncbi:uncharacterized protein LY89DRAFT_779589 [Mollisia scopiformis]|uniref:Uncharacterized protein n=1 Tax=Mollisia scopiformis TaxID=149040 RepID=A0A194XHN3_MOLSC|nr:uncharacterized protein LY89DRAFT_779589 [Mollisia scopiformis]KUJ19668.1 hypothetical protein LY89DRAFT_779589 [Mollisia scopiformis]
MTEVAIEDDSTNEILSVTVTDEAIDEGTILVETAKEVLSANVDDGITDDDTKLVLTTTEDDGTSDVSEMIEETEVSETIEDTEDTMLLAMIDEDSIIEVSEIVDTRDDTTLLLGTTDVDKSDEVSTTLVEAMEDIWLSTLVLGRTDV